MASVQLWQTHILQGSWLSRINIALVISLPFSVLFSILFRPSSFSHFHAKKQRNNGENGIYAYLGYDIVLGHNG